MIVTLRVNRTRFELFLSETCSAKRESLMTTARISRKRGTPLGGPGAVRPKTRVPAFKTEAEERAFWETHESTAYVDWSRAELVRLPNLKL